MDVNYEASPSRIDEPVSVEELREILDEGDLKPFAKNPTWLTHLLGRMVVTIEGLRRQIYLLHRDIQQATVARSQMGAPTTLNPVDALKFLTPEQRAAALDGATRDALSGAERAKNEARAAQAAANKVVNEVNLVVGSICDDPSTPPALRNRLETLLKRVGGASGGELGDLFE